MTQTRGVVYIHSTPSALCPHLEWGLGAVFAAPTHVEWTRQPAQPNTYRAELSWSGPVGTGARLASTLKGWGRVRFEVTEERTSTSDGTRWSYTPDLGIFQAAIGIHGDIMVPEERLKAALVTEALGGKSLATSLDELLGRPWDDELEAFRHAGEDTPVRWLHQVV